MSSFRELSADDRATYIREAASRRSTTPVIVEKDAWVTWILARLFEEDALRDVLLFKGGTSLAKAFKVIERFSEDVDLGIQPEVLGVSASDLRSGSKTGRAKKVRELQHKCSTYVKDHVQPCIERRIVGLLGSPSGEPWLEYVDEGSPPAPVLRFRYPSSQVPDSYVQQFVKLEFGSLTEQEPLVDKDVDALLCEALGTSLTDLRGSVRVLSLHRTFWEKATILHAEHHRAADKAMPARYARHYSDFVSLYKHEDGHAAAGDYAMLDSVRMHKQAFFNAAWARYELACRGSLRLCPPEARVPELTSDLTKMAPMFLGAPPTIEHVLTTLREAEAVINRP